MDLAITLATPVVAGWAVADTCMKTICRDTNKRPSSAEDNEMMERYTKAHPELAPPLRENEDALNKPNTENNSKQLNKDDGSVTQNKEAGSVTLNKEDESQLLNKEAASKLQNREAESKQLNKETESKPLNNKFGSKQLIKQKKEYKQNNFEPQTKRDGSKLLYQQGDEKKLYNQDNFKPLSEQDNCKAMHIQDDEKSFYKEAESPPLNKETDSKPMIEQELLYKPHDNKLPTIQDDFKPLYTQDHPKSQDKQNDKIRTIKCSAN